ncbi:MAG: tetratricopeptide repeat protein [Pseudomonadota bacterium]
MERTEQARIIEREDHGANADLQSAGDEFLAPEDLVPLGKQAAKRTLVRVLAETEELFRENRWDDLLSLFYPVDEKVPELVEQGLDAEMHYKCAFALGKVRRFDDAIAELRHCVEKDPENFHFHSSLSYTAYDSLYAARNRDILLSGKLRADRIALAHAHFQKANELRPDGVTNFYREGMLFKQIERKPDKALPLFAGAVTNWESLSEEEKGRRNQERKNYIKALYQLASCLLDAGRPDRALGFIKKCLKEDERSGYLSLVHKHFALGKVLFHQNAFGEARDALLFAERFAGKEPADFVLELLARTWLALGRAEKALETVRRVPEKQRRPYIRWTEADTLCMMKAYGEAAGALKRSVERDSRSRHKGLVRLARINYLLGRFQEAAAHAEQAIAFFREKWNGVFAEGFFWAALARFRQGETGAAREALKILKAHNPQYPGLGKLEEKLKSSL